MIDLFITSERFFLDVGYMLSSQSLYYYIQITEYMSAMISAQLLVIIVCICGKDIILYFIS